MSRIFGEIRQIAFVAHAIDAAMDYWANALGIGPFFIKRKIVLADLKEPEQYQRVLGIAKAAESWKRDKHVVEVAE